MATRKKVVVQVDETKRCANCEHFSSDAGETVCRRYPRQFVYLEEEISLCYPPHKEDDLCGEFKRKVNA